MSHFFYQFFNQDIRIIYYLKVNLYRENNIPYIYLSFLEINYFGALVQNSYSHFKGI